VPRYVDDQQAAGMFTLADALVLPYREASGSGVAALALHYHTPVVASRVGGLAESIIEGETGMLVPPGDPAALATAIQRLQQSRDWPALIAKHQQAATWQGLAAAIEQSIASITPPDSTIAETAAANEAANEAADIHKSPAKSNR
jgi:glycosyltransferase involved in cell wall biosynthesis